METKDGVTVQRLQQLTLNARGHASCRLHGRTRAHAGSTFQPHLAVHLLEHVKLSGFIRPVMRIVAVVPVRHHPPALERSLLARYRLFCKRPCWRGGGKKGTSFTFGRCYNGIWEKGGCPREHIDVGGFVGATDARGGGAVTEDAAASSTSLPVAAPAQMCEASETQGSQADAASGRFASASPFCLICSGVRLLVLTSPSAFSSIGRPWQSQPGT